MSLSGLCRSLMFSVFSLQKKENNPATTVQGGEVPMEQGGS